MSRLALCLAATLTVACGVLEAQQGSRAPATAVDTTIFLRPGDAIRLRFFGDSGGSGEYRVDEHGMISLPLLGQRDATHRDPDLLKREIIDGYARTYRYPPDAIVLRRIAVLGAVVRPGLYLADATMSLSELLTLAGGPLPTGRSGEVQLIRDGQSMTAAVIGPSDVGFMRLHSGDRLYVPERNWWSRNIGIVVGSLGAVVAVISLFTR